MKTERINRDRKPTPFLKWAGGKAQLLDQFDPLFPGEKFNAYHEPFLGGGAVFFHIYNRGMINEALLSDSNEELINTYEVIRDDPASLGALLSVHKEKHSKDYYYFIRDLDRKPEVALTNIERAARMIYLNKTCFNGLWRVNNRGQFNVPMGKYANPSILDEENIYAVSTALSNVVFSVGDYKNVVQKAKQKDFIYFDPPYVPLTTTSSFTQYTAENFSLRDQEELADTFNQLDMNGCYVMLSNSDSPIVRELYAPYRIEIVRATRAINSNANGRGAVNELVILNY